MARKKCFLLNTSKFRADTSWLTNEETGQYIILLCYQVEYGHLSIDMIKRIIGEIPSEFVMALFAQGQDGRFYSEMIESQHQEKLAGRNSMAYKIWKSTVFARDNYTCTMCGDSESQLNAHHIKPWAKYPDFRFDVDNGITLCEKCHKKVHSRR